MRWLYFMSIFFIAAAGVSTLVAAEEHLYCNTIKPKQYNEVWKQQFDSEFLVRYDDRDREFLFYSNEAIAVFGFCLNSTQVDSLVSIIEKYKEWNIKASKKEVKLDKEIAKLPTKYTFCKMGDDWSVGPSIDISVYFFSQTPKVHQLVFLFPKFTSRTNEYDTHKGETLYFNWDNALAMIEIFSDKYFGNFMINLEKQKAIDEEFQ
jgi:hypothetical protein